MSDAVMPTSWAFALGPSLFVIIAFASLQLRPTSELCASLSILFACVVVGNFLAGYLRWRKNVDIMWLMFNLATLFWFALPGLQRVVDGRPWVEEAVFVRAQEPEFQRALALVGLFYLIFTVAYGIRLPQQAVDRVRRVVLPNAKFVIGSSWLLVLLVLLVALGFYIALSGSVLGGLNNILAMRSESKPWSSDGNYGTSLTPFNVLNVAAQVVIANIAGTWALRKDTEFRRRMIFVGIGLVSLLMLALSGTRSLLALGVIPPLILLFRPTHRTSLRGRVSTIAVAFVAIAGLLFVGNIMRTARNSGDLVGGFDSAEVVVEDNDGLTHTAFTLSEMKREPATHDSIIWVIITGPVPRALWRSKPELTVMNIHSYYVWGRDVTKTGGNTLPFLVGQGLLSWGWLGLVEIAVALGLLSSLVDGIINRNVTIYVQLFAAALATWMFVVFRLIGFSFFFQIYVFLFLIRIEYHLGLRQEELLLS